jgi:MFS family permease
VSTSDNYKPRPATGFITRNVFFLGLVSLFNDMSSDMIIPLLPVFLPDVLGASASSVGIIEGIAESTASILKLFSGWLSDKLKKRKFLVVIGYGLSTVVKTMFAFATNAWQVLAARFGDRVGKGVRTAARDALIADSSTIGTRGRSFGVHRAMDTIGATLGPLLAFLILRFVTTNLRHVFLLSFLGGSIALVFLIFKVRDTRPTVQSDKPLPRLGWNIFSPTFKLFLLATFIFSLGNSSDAFLTLKARHVGIDVTWIPLLYVMFNIPYVLLATITGVIADKIGFKKVLLTGFVWYALVYLGLAVATTSGQIVLLFIGYGCYYALTEGIQKAWIADLVPAELRATAYGTHAMLTGIALLPASIVAGYAWDHISVAATFLIGTVLALVASGILAFIKRTSTS